MNLNKALIAGNLTRDPELKHSKSGKPWASISLALNERDPDGNERVNYIDVLLFGKTAEAAAKHLRKGSGLFVEGALQQDRWEDKDGQKRSRVLVRARYIQFTGGRRDGSGNQTREEQRHEVSPEEESDDLEF